MHPTVRDILSRQLATNWADFRGASIDARLPIRQAVLDRIVAEMILPAAPALNTLQVTIRPDNVLEIAARASALAFLPAVTMRLTVERDVEISPSPTVRVWLPGEGLGRLAAPLISWWRQKLPPGVRVDGQAIDIDLGELLERRGLAPYVSLLRSARIESEPGTLWLTLQAGVSAPGT